MANGKRTKENRKEADRLYRERHRAQIRERSNKWEREWRKSNPDKSLKDRVKEKARIKMWREKNKDRIRIQTRGYREKNKEHIRVLLLDWYKKNQDLVKEYHRNAKARRKGAEGKHTAADISALFLLQRGLCATCKNRITKTGDRKYHVDHVQPIIKGGSNNPDNLQLLCPKCNLSKGPKSPEQWAKENGLLFC